MEVAKLLIDVIGERPPTSNSSMSLAFQDALQQLESKRIKLPEDMVDEMDEEGWKILELKEYDKNNDLAWMTYNSWNSFDVMFRRLFQDTIDPLFWNGLYFSKSKFFEFKEMLLPYCGDVSISLVKDGDGLEFLCIGSDGNAKYDQMGIVQMRAARRKYESNVIKLLGFCSSTNSIVEVNRADI